ncbi:M48 family metalloprotease [Actinoplanes aureus]|uniref:M48 family metalloprotease n=1 Tax=Actinoplanes aureus TaxID=2792083 RepID=A0A931CAF9_9ACTN|nr:M48 family metalloprotease [Actinoplanes aureus]MBG0562518.1 M48 family metalloprotease [Actinoplanes aureus]
MTTAVPVRRPPSATRGQYLLVIVVLLLAGAFAGRVGHLLLAGEEWIATTSACLSSAAEIVPDPTAIPERQRVFNECRATVEHRLAGYDVAGALLTLTLAMAFAWLLPRLMLRRVGPRRPVPGPLRDRAAAIAAQLGVRRAPALEMGPWDLQEPFTVRANGATRIVLPPGVRRLPEEALDAVLRHETAHVAAGDVTLVWLTRSTLWALPVMLPIPLVVATIQGRLGDVPFWLEYLSRGALLWLAAYLLARGVMRTREHEADTHAARAGSGQALAALLTAAPPPRPGRLSRLLAMHPPPARRVAILRDPSLLPGIPAVTAAVAAALAMAIWSFGATIVAAGLLATPLEPYSPFLAGLLAVALLATTWGLALWLRAATSGAPQAPTPGPPRAAMLGLAAGSAAGLLLSLNPAAMLTVAGAPNWRQLIFVPLTLAGAGGCTLALTATRSRPGPWRRQPASAPLPAGSVPASESFAPIEPVPIAAPAAPAARAMPARHPGAGHPVPQFPAPGAGRRWPVTAVLSAAAFAGAIWIGSVLAVPLPFATFGLPDGLIGLLWQGGFAGEWRHVIAVGVVAFALAATAGLGRRAGLVAAGGLLAGLGALAVRWLAPLGPVEPHHVGERDWWTGAAAGFAVTLLLLGLRGASGLGDALLAAPVAALTVSAGVLLRFLPGYEDPLSSALIYASRPLSMLALLTLAVGAAAGLLPSRPPATGRRAWLTAATGAGLAAALTLAVLLSGDRFLSAGL